MHDALTSGGDESLYRSHGTDVPPPGRVATGNKHHAGQSQIEATGSSNSITSDGMNNIISYSLLSAGR